MAKLSLCHHLCWVIIKGVMDHKSHGSNCITDWIIFPISANLWKVHNDKRTFLLSLFYIEELMLVSDS